MFFFLCYKTIMGKCKFHKLGLWLAHCLVSVTFPIEEVPLFPNNPFYSSSFSCQFRKRCRFDYFPYSAKWCALSLPHSVFHICSVQCQWWRERECDGHSLLRRVNVNLLMLISFGDRLSIALPNFINKCMNDELLRLVRVTLVFLEKI